MAEPANRLLSFTETDMDFIVGEAAPDVKNPDQLKQLIRDDEKFRKALVGDEKVFQRVMDDDEIFLKVSPSLYFEVLLRRALQELETATYTLERSGRQSIPVFDTQQVVEFLDRSDVLVYLADMLASFTRIQSHVVQVRVRRGIRRRVRYNDMDIDSLMRLCATADEEQRLGLYKRIADVCLFTTGIFVDHPSHDHKYQSSGQARPMSARRVRRSLEEYEEEGRRFYGLAEEHPAAHALRQSDIFGLLRQHFTSARKPLAFIAANYLHSGKQQLFGAESG